MQHTYCSCRATHTSSCHATHACVQYCCRYAIATSIERVAHGTCSCCRPKRGLRWCGRLADIPRRRMERNSHSRRANVVRRDSLTSMYFSIREFGRSTVLRTCPLTYPGYVRFPLLGGASHSRTWVPPFVSDHVRLVTKTSWYMCDRGVGRGMAAIPTASAGVKRRDPFPQTVQSWKICHYI